MVSVINATVWVGIKCFWSREAVTINSTREEEKNASQSWEQKFLIWTLKDQIENSGKALQAHENAT